MEESWRILREAMVGAVEVVGLAEERKRRNGWINEEILELMGERRRKTANIREYAERDREIKRKCMRSKRAVDKRET